MKKTTSKVLSLILGATLLLTSCGGENKDGGSNKPEQNNGEEARYEIDANTPAYKLDEKEMTELDWYVNADWWNTDWGNDVVTKKIEEELNVKINFRVGDDTTLNTMFAGEDMPDLITIFDTTSDLAREANKWAMPIQDLADKYDPYFYKVASEETLAWLQLNDGKTYGYPDYSNTTEDYESGMLFATTAFVVRKDVYEAIGKPDMTTPEGFMEALEKIKAEFPELLTLGFNALGPDSVASLGAPLQNLLGVPVVDENNKYVNRDLDEDYLKWIKVLNDAHTQGYINDDSFTDSGTNFEEKIASGQYAAVICDGTPQVSGFFTTWMHENPEGMYIAVDGPKSTVGRDVTLSQSGITGWMQSYITKNCKDPAKAIQLFTYLLSEEGQILTTYGIEGETYKVNDEGKYELLPEVSKMREENNDRFKKEYRLGEFIFFGHDKYKALSDDAYPESIKQMQEWGEGKLKPQFIVENITPEPGTPEARNLSNIRAEWATSLVSMIRSKSDDEFNSIVEAFKQTLEDNDFESIEEKFNENIERNAKKLEEGK